MRLPKRNMRGSEGNAGKETGGAGRRPERQDLVMTNPDRVAFTLFGHSIYWYGVLMAVGIIVAIYLSMIEAKRKKVHEDTMLDLFIIVILCGVVGARLFYVVFEWDNFFGPGKPWWKPFAVWEGGLAIYGAIIGGLAGMFVYSRKKKMRFLRLADIISPGLVLAQAIGRWGNFFNQEAYGMPITNPDMLWFPFAVKIDVPWNNGIHYFNGAICDNPYHMATFFYESAWCLLVFLFLWFFLRKRTKHDGDVFVWYLLLYSFERMFVEGLRGDSLWLIKDVVRVSQALSLVLFVGVAAFLLVRHFKEKKLGALIWPATALAEGEEADPTGEDAGAKEQPEEAGATEDAEPEESEEEPIEEDEEDSDKDDED